MEFRSKHLLGGGRDPKDTELEHKTIPACNSCLLFFAQKTLLHFSS